MASRSYMRPLYLIELVQFFRPGAVRVLMVTLTLAAGIWTDAVARVAHGYSPVLAIHLATSSVRDETPVTRTSVSAVYPNPFNPRTTIVFETAEPLTIELAIYDVAGRRVRVLESGNLVSGRFEIEWDGRNQQGEDVATGAYLCRLKYPGGSSTRKLMLAR